MGAGAKNRLIEIWKPSSELDSTNRPVGWCRHKTKWAEIKGQTGMKVVRAAASAGGIVTPLNSYSFRVNYDRSIDTTMQVRNSEGDRMNIVSAVHDLAGRDFTDLVCELGGSNG